MLLERVYRARIGADDDPLGMPIKDQHISLSQLLHLLHGQAKAQLIHCNAGQSRPGQNVSGPKSSPLSLPILTIAGTRATGIFPLETHNDTAWGAMPKLRPICIGLPIWVIIFATSIRQL